MIFKEFLARHSVFTTDELKEYLAQHESVNKWTRKASLDHHVKSGNIIRVRKGLYCSVPPGSKPESVQIDPWLLTSKMAPDAVISHHSALSYFGKAYSVSGKFTYYSSSWKPSLDFRSYTFTCVQVPTVLRKKKVDGFGVKTSERAGQEVKVTDLERTLVDLLDKPEYGYGWEEIWRSLMEMEYIDFEVVAEYVSLRGNSTIAAKTALFLNMYSEERHHLKKIPKTIIDMLPAQPRYMDTNHKKPSRLVKQFNLIVPLDVLDQNWSEY